MAFPSEIEKLRRRWQENPLGLTFAPYAEACRKAGDLATALQVLAEGIERHPDYVPAHIVHGRRHPAPRPARRAPGRCLVGASAGVEGEGVFGRGQDPALCGGAGVGIEVAAAVNDV